MALAFHIVFASIGIDLLRMMVRYLLRNVSSVSAAAGLIRAGGIG